jgi:dCMP deaminase
MELQKVWIIIAKIKTKAEVLHAEMNSITKLAKSTESGDQSVMFITHGPCLECAKSIYQTGITDVYYVGEYRDKTGIDFLQCVGVNVTKLT